LINRFLAQVKDNSTHMLPRLVGVVALVMQQCGARLHGVVAIMPDVHGGYAGIGHWECLVRKVSLQQTIIFLALFTFACVLGLALNWVLFARIELGEFNGVFKAVTGFGLMYACVALVFRAFIALFPLPEGDIPAGSALECRYHVYLLFFLIAFYPIMFSMILPVPLMRVFYQLLGARLGANTYPGGVVMDPPFVDIGSNTLIGQGALIVPHVIEGERLAHHRVRIGDNVTIGARSTVLAGCTIGHGAVIAVGAVVRKGSVVGAGEVWGGVPARCIQRPDGAA
jgi:acetyltransferase-like isoleucine patch superfamily enzyme